MADSSLSTSNSTPPHLSSTRPWVERYRPKTLKDISHQTEIVATLQNATTTGRLPHLLFYGPPGSGKVRFVLMLRVKILCFLEIEFFQILISLFWFSSSTVSTSFFVQKNKE